MIATTTAPRYCTRCKIIRLSAASLSSLCDECQYDAEHPSTDIQYGKRTYKVNVSQMLRKRYGGTWTYNPFSGVWLCDDGKRHVARVSACTCDGECHCGAEARLCLYGPEGAEWVNI